MPALHTKLPRSAHSTLFGSSAFAFRVGNRMLTVQRDTRHRYYPTHPLLSLHPGTARGTLEILIARTWSILLSPAR